MRKPSKKNPSLEGLLRNVRIIKELVSELKELHPEILKVLSSGNKNLNLDPQIIKSAMSFAVNKVMNNPYIVLGVSPDDPPELIDAVYKVKAKFYHPDNKETGDSAKFMRITEAYDKIKGEIK